VYLLKTEPQLLGYPALSFIAIPTDGELFQWNMTAKRHQKLKESPGTLFEFFVVVVYVCHDVIS
jgi:hypothetical protein